MALRRSERLAPKLRQRYLTEFFTIKTSLSTIRNMNICCTFKGNTLSPEYKIDIIIKSANLMAKNFAFLLKYEYSFTRCRGYEIFCDMLYKKSFDWIKETIIVLKDQSLDPIYLVNLKKISQKFRKVYEKLRYVNWIFIKSKYNLDDSIMYLINTYMHYYNK
jgi:hypothetical protein